jgi:hypothetical protein
VTGLKRNKSQLAHKPSNSAGLPPPTGWGDKLRPDCSTATKAGFNNDSNKMYKQTIAYIFLLFVAFAFGGCHNKKHTTTTVRYQIEGCFGSEERVIKIDHYKDNAIATLEINGKKVKQAPITEGQIPALSMFRRELEEWVGKQNSHSSTANETISIQMGHIREVMQYRGHWDGFNRLTFALLHFSE